MTKMGFVIVGTVAGALILGGIATLVHGFNTMALQMFAIWIGSWMLGLIVGVLSR